MNDDLISRQAAIDDVLNLKCETRVSWKDAVIDTLDALPSAQQEPQWIPVTERLPERNGRYLVTRGLIACGSLWNRTYIANYSDLMGLKKEKIWWNGNVGKSDFRRLEDVTAWMPLPE